VERNKEEFMRFVKTLCCAAAVVACFAPGARADEWNKKTILTFSGPVQVPGVTLPAGTYVFKLADLNGNRHVVQVFDQNEKKLYSTILAIPDERPEPVDKPVVLFSERSANTPQAIRSWFYPGERIGNEFVYPRFQAMTIARNTHQGVLSTEESYTPEKSAAADETMKSSKVTRIDENGREQAAASASTPEASTPPATTASRDARLKNSSGNTASSSATAGSVGTSGQTQSPPPAPAPTANRRTRLPQTASNLPLYELLSGLMLASALALRVFRSRRTDLTNIGS